LCDPYAVAWVLIDEIDGSGRRVRRLIPDDHVGLGLSGKILDVLPGTIRVRARHLVCEDFLQHVFQSIPEAARGGSSVGLFFQS
jgi:hypothetical protein